MTIQPEKLTELARLVKEVAAQESMKYVATYAGALAELATLHDEIARHPKGTAENYTAFAATRKLWDAARVYAKKYGLLHPTDALRDMGYPV
jgi:hypothetical protein